MRAGLIFQGVEESDVENVNSIVEGFVFFKDLSTDNYAAIPHEE